MKTTIYHHLELTKSEVKSHIKKTIQSGGLVVFPTETVYGIGANAKDSLAVNRIYQAKGRPSDNPLIVHIAHQEDVKLYIKELPSIALPLMEAFWPGPLTLIFKKNEVMPLNVTGGLDTIAIRMPSHPIALEIIKMSETPICAPSANVSGKPSSTLFEHVKYDFMNRVDIIIDGGKTHIGLESTVLDITQPVPVILRPGSITKSMIESVIGMHILDASETEVLGAPKSPGMKYKHYAPKGEVILVEGDLEKLINYFQKLTHAQTSEKIGFVGANEIIEALETPHKAYLGPIDNLGEVASNIFIALRQMDALEVDKIYIHTFSHEAIGQAIMNRLSKASNYKSIKL